jgi:hypothetical protein
MNDTSAHREPRPRARWWPACAIGAVLAGTALLVSACGGSPATPSAGPPTLATLTDQALAYAKCMRAHGIPNFPDPTVQDNAHAKGVGFSLNGINANSPHVKAAAKTCQRQTGFGHITAAQLQAGMTAMLKFAECMRSHGIANFPDPFENSHQIGFNLDGTGVDQNSSRFTAAQKVCQPPMPGGGP